MEYFLLILLTLLNLNASRAQDENGEWTMDQPIYKVPGETFYLQYTTVKDLMACAFNTPDKVNIKVTPGSSNVSTAEDRPPEWTWTWKGDNEKKDCGIQINRAVMADNGTWQVVAVVTGSDIVAEEVSVTILELEAPDRIILDPDSIAPITILPDTVPDTIIVTCTAYETRGNVTFTWWIGDTKLDGFVSDYNSTENMDQDSSLQYMDVSQMIQYVPHLSHDNKQLVCNASHSQYGQDDLLNKTNIASIDITIKDSPKGCPDKWMDGRIVDMGCLNFNTSNFTWIEASRHCMAQDGFLVQILNKEQQEYVRAITLAIEIGSGQAMDWWIGATDINDEGNWSWSHSKTPVSITSWADGEPSGETRQNFGILRGNNNYDWNDVEEESLCHAICQIYIN